MDGLIQLSEHDYYIDGFSKIGIVKISDSDVVLIDSGNSKSIGKTVLSITEKRGWNIKAVFLTHGHSDHMSGNRVIQERTNCPVYAEKSETVIGNFPVFQPALMFGAFPLDELRCEFFEAETSRVTLLSEAENTWGIQVINLNGHTDDMVGYLTPDGTFFIGDALISEVNLRKYPVSFLTDVSEFIATLEKLESIKAEHFVPSHAPVQIDIKHLVQGNIDNVKNIAEFIFNCCKAPITFEDILAVVFKHYNIPENAAQYFLIGSIVKAYLNYLIRQNRVCYKFENGLMLWQKKSPEVV